MSDSVSNKENKKNIKLMKHHRKEFEKLFWSVQDTSNHGSMVAVSDWLMSLHVEILVLKGQVGKLQMFIKDEILILNNLLTDLIEMVSDE